MTKSSIRDSDVSKGPNPSVVGLVAWDLDELRERRRYELGLDSSSTVWDVGGYEGVWARGVFDRYKCRIDVFEPVPMYTNSIREAFIGVDSVRVYGYGLGAHTERKTFSVSGVATSSLHALGQGQLEELEIRDIAAVWAELGVKELSLLKLNVEGAEYELLDRLIETDMIKRIKCVQVQFHDFVPNATVMVADLRRRLAKTHAQTYCFDFIWEQWTRLDDISPGQLSAALLERSELEKRLSLGLFQAEAKVRDLSVQILSREDWLDLDDPAKRAEAVRSLSARELVSGLYLKGISLLRRIRGLSRAPKSSKE